MSNENNILEEAEKFLDFLEKHKNDKGVMADLRASVVENLSYRSWKYLVPFGSIKSSKSNILKLIAYMYSIFPSHSAEEGNFGQTIQKIEYSRNKDEISDVRFRIILSSDRSNITDRIQKFSGLLKNVEGLKINYIQLYIDLYYWSDNIKKDWAQSFYNPKKSK